MSDVLTNNEGTIIALTVLTPAARQWIEEKCKPEPWQWVGDTFAVEPRYAGDIIQGMQADGLIVE